MPKKNDPQSKPHYKGLTHKQGRFVDEIVKGVKQNGELNRSEAAQKTYNVKSKEVACSVGSQQFSKLNVRKAFLAEMRAEGLTSRRSIKTHASIFDATKRQLDPDGNYTETPDYPTRLRAVQEFNKIADVYPDKQSTTHTLNLYADLTPQQLEAEEQKAQKRIQELEAEE